MPVLYGKTVMLREYRREDLEDIRAWVNDPAVTRYLGGGSLLKPQTCEMTRAFLEAKLAGGYQFVIARLSDGAYLGQIDACDLDLINRRAEIGIVLGDKSWQGRGYGTEALGLMVKYLFTQVNLNRVTLQVEAENAAAIRCYEKCGFRQEGVLRSHVFREGMYRDVWVMGLLRDEWQQTQKT